MEITAAAKPGYQSSYDDFDQFEAGVAEDRPTVTPTQVQQAEAPRGPHKAPSRRQETSRPQGDRKEFGEGIFD